MSATMQVVFTALKVHEMSEDRLPSLHQAFKQMSAQWRILSMACKLRTQLPRELLQFWREKSTHWMCHSLETLIFHLLADSLAPKAKEEFGSVEACREWEKQVERAEPVLKQAMLHAERQDQAR